MKCELCFNELCQTPHILTTDISNAVLSLILNGKPFKPNFRQRLYLKSYVSLYQAVSAFGLKKSFDIAKEDYVGKYSMWGYDLTADQGSEEGQLHPIKNRKSSN